MQEIDIVIDGIYLESIKIDLNECEVNGGMGETNIFGRRVRKSIIFPIAKLNYAGDKRVESVKYNRSIDLKDAALTVSNFEGAGCGKTYFVVSNTKTYSLYDINGHFLRYIPITEYGRIICLGALSFVTKSDSGTLHLWSCKGVCSEGFPATPENIKYYGWQKGKLIKKSESYSFPFPENEDLYF